MPNPWTGKGNPYTRKEVVERLRAQLKKGRPIVAAGTEFRQVQVADGGIEMDEQRVEVLLDAIDVEAARSFISCLTRVGSTGTSG